MTIESDRIDYRVEQISWAEFNISCYLTCEYGYYYEGNNDAGVCRMCPLECPKCINANTCCEDRHIYLTASDSCLLCGTSQYVSNNACTDCPTGCQQCTSASACSECETGYHLEAGVCNKDVEKEAESSLMGIVIGVSIAVLLIIALTIFLLWLLCSPSGEECRKKCSKGDQSSEEDHQQSYIYTAKPPTIQQILVNDECAVCLQQHLDTTSACGHSFHLECLKEWTSKLMRCPVCRSQQMGPVDVYCTKCTKMLQRLEMSELHTVVLRCDCGNESSMDIHSKQTTDRKLEISGGLLQSSQVSTVKTQRR